MYCTCFCSDEGLEYQQNIGLLTTAQDIMAAPQNHFRTNESYPIWTRDEEGHAMLDSNQSFYMPTWQTSPVYYRGTNVNENILKSSDSTAKGCRASFEKQSVVIGEFTMAEPGSMRSSDPKTALMALMLSAHHEQDMEYEGDPMSQVFFPIFDSFREGRIPVATMGAWVHWGQYFREILPSNLKGKHRLSDFKQRRETYSQPQFTLSQRDIPCPARFLFRCFHL